MAMSQKAFENKTGLNITYDGYWGKEAAFGGGGDENLLPCFANRWKVNDKVNTPALIAAYIQLASDADNNDVLVFSVTERDACWKDWKAYAKAHPRTFKVVEGGSIHGNYQCRMYIYVKPASKKKYAKNKVK